LCRYSRVELHAHLNGCVRDATLLDCARRRALDDDDNNNNNNGRQWTMEGVRAMLRKPDGTGARPLQQCFDLFGGGGCTS
jgi:hypothetical protein